MATLLGDPEQLAFEDSTHRLVDTPGDGRGIKRLFTRKTLTLGGNDAHYWTEAVDVATAGGGGAVTIADGADVAEGTTTDAADLTGTAGTAMSKLRGLVQLLNTRVPAKQLTLTDRSGTIAAGATAQQLAAANSSRRYLIIANPITATEALWFNFTTTAVVGSPSIGLNAGDSFVMEAGPISTEAISVIAATIGHAYTAKEG